MEMKHTLAHAINSWDSGCRCDMELITHCVICERRFRPDRDHVDTCKGACYRKLLELQRQRNDEIDRQEGRS